MEIEKPVLWQEAEKYPDNLMNGSSLIKNYGSRIDRLLFWSLCGLFFFIPVATSPAVIIGLLGLSLWIFSGKFITERERWLKAKWLPPVILFMALPWIGLLWSNDIHEGLDFARKSYYWLFAFMVASMTLSSRDVTVLLDFFIGGLVFVCCVSLLQFIGLIPMVEWLPATFSRKSIIIGLLLVYGMLVLSFYFSKGKGMGRTRTLSLLLIALFCLALAIGTGRIGYLAFVLLLPLVIYNLLGQRNLVKIIIITLPLLVVFFLSPVVQNRISLVMSDIKEYQKGNPNTSIGLRLNMWNGAIRIFLENPIIGAGTGSYMLEMKKYHHPKLDPEFQNFSEPHNSFLYMAASFGVMGLISLSWLFLVFLKKGWVARASIPGFAVLAFGLVLLIGSLTATQILSYATGKMFALLMGIEIAQRDERQGIAFNRNY